MKYSFSLLLLIAVLSSYAQTGSDLKGSWVRVLETTYEDDIRQSFNPVDEDYMKIHFDGAGRMKIYATYQAHGIQIPYKQNGDKLSFGVGRQFKIEQYSDERLILTDLTGGQVTRKSNRHYYQRETLFLNALPYPSEDLVIIGGDTAYLASKKLFPAFQTTDTPDFHIFIHNQIKSSYAIGENYFHATFMIRPDGTIDHINIHHRISKANDKRAFKAIRSSAGRWKMPELNGKPVNIIMSVEDLFNKSSDNNSRTPPKIEIDYSAEDPEVYMRYFNLVVRKALRNKPEEALAYLKLFEERKPRDPNLHYLRYKLYKALGTTQAAQENKTRVQRSRLRYLLKQ